MRRGYRFVGHTADVEFEAYGSGVEELFRNALLAMFDTAADVHKLARQRSAPVGFPLKEKSKDLSDLLWMTLQDALSAASAKGLFGYKVPQLKVAESKGLYSLSAEILGRKETPQLSKLDVKGVSKYDLNVTKSKKGMKSTVVLDV